MTPTRSRNRHDKLFHTPSARIYGPSHVRPRTFQLRHQIGAPTAGFVPRTPIYREAEPLPPIPAVRRRRQALICLRRIFLAATAIILALLQASCSKKEVKVPRDTTVPVTVTKVESLPLDRSISIVGTLYAKDEALVAAQVEGQVEKTRVDFGDRVTEGQEIAQIDTTSYDALANQANANLTKSQANAANAERTLKRTQDLQKDKISSASELDTATSAAEQARAEVKGAEAASVVARLNLERSRVKAPFNGAIAERIASGGDFKKIGEPLFRVVNDAVLKFIFQVPERYASYVQKKLPVQFSVDNYPGEVFTGTVYLISPSVSMSSRSFGVGALVTNTNFRLKANTFARGSLVLEREVPTQMVPVEAVVSFAGVTKIFVVEGDVARAKAVTVGRVQNGKQEIVSGLTGNETVVVSGQSKLSDGAGVKIQTPTPVTAAAPLAQTAK